MIKSGWWAGGEAVENGWDFRFPVAGCCLVSRSLVILVDVWSLWSRWLFRCSSRDTFVLVLGPLYMEFVPLGKGTG